MNGDARSFGARLCSEPPAERFALHATEGDRHDFADYDRVLAGLFDDAIRGKPILDLQRGSRSETDVVTLKLADDDREVLSRVLAPDEQRARGAWYAPATCTSLLGVVEFARWAAAEPRFSMAMADAQRATVLLDTPDALAIWAALEPVMELLYLPLRLRSGRWLGNGRPDEMDKDWSKVDTTYRALAIDTGPLAIFKDGRRWATLGIDGVIAARQALLEAWNPAPTDVGERAIVLLISLLVERYYKKAKDGQAQRTKVMTKNLERALSGAFGGDWLALVRYLGEDLHPAEQIATAVEATSLFVSGRNHAAAAAATTGVPVEEVERILSAYWGGQNDSPVERRAQVMREWWRRFDELHARQASGMPSLSGLLSDRREGSDLDVRQYNRLAYQMLPPALNNEIEQLWGTAVLSRWPSVLVSEPYPHASLADTLGPGIAFWHELAMTCWLICEGAFPWSKTDIDGMPQQFRRQAETLDEAGCPIDPAVFADLRCAEQRLTDRPLVDSRGNKLPIASSTKKDGFEHLNDVVSEYRRAWAAEHLERYLQGRWESDLRAVGDNYHRQIADKNKPPTLEQFANIAEQPANHWFGGHLNQLASALGLPAPDPQECRRLLPADRVAFVARIRELLGGQRWEELPRDIDVDERERRHRRSELADHAPTVVQIWEATGERPQLRSAWARYRLERAFGPNTDAGRETFLAAVEQALREAAAPSAVGVPAPVADNSAMPLPVHGPPNPAQVRPQ